MGKVSTFEELSLSGLQDIYDAEHQITEALPKMVEVATSEELKKAFNLHLAQTKNQITRLEKVFAILGEKAERKTCLAAKGLIAEGKEHIKEITPGPLLDAALIEGAQKIEHYEIAAYGTARTYANRAGNKEVASLLDETLDEEASTDKKLTTLAETVVNPLVASKN